MRSTAVPVASSRVYYADNKWIDGAITKLTKAQLTSWTWTDEVTPTFWPTGLIAATADSIEATVKSFVGARPAERDSVDSRYITEITNRAGGGKVYDGPTTGSGAMTGTTLLTYPGSVPTYAFNQTTFPASPPSGGSWRDIVACSDGVNRTKLEKYLNDLEDALL
jgi:hypothetical protein